MTFQVRVDIPAEGHIYTRDYDCMADRDELMGLIEDYMIHLCEGESMTLTCVERVDE